MGLITAAISAVSGTISDMWKEYFTCPALDNNTLVAKGVSNAKGAKAYDNVITNGSGIVVADGQCVLIVEKGQVVEVASEPGEYTFDQSSTPSVFCGSLSESIKQTLAQIADRFEHNGQASTDSRVYYINTKEITDNKFGTATPVPFRVVDSRINLDVDVSVRCAGSYSFKIVDPVLFYTNVCGNIDAQYDKAELATQMKAEFLSALQPAFGKISALEIRPYDLVNHTTEMEDALNAALDVKWGQARGIEVATVAFNTVTLPDEDAQMIKDMQKTLAFTNTAYANAAIASATADAMKIAAGNANGAATGFMNMNMANATGASAYQNANNNTTAWKCACGNTNTGNFCPVCGAKKPE